MADLTLPEVITRFRGNEARIADFANGNAAGYYITVDGKKVETLPSVVSRLAAAIAAASATAETLKGTGGAKLIGFGAVTVDAALTTQAKGIADNAKAITDLDTAKLAKGGGTMTGPLKLAGEPTDPLHAASKGWAEGLIGAYWKPGIGDVLTTTRGAPDANWIPDGADYLQASYPALFAKLGLLGTDTTNSFVTSSATPSTRPAPFSAFGKDGVLIVGDVDANNVPSFRRSTDLGLTFTSVASPTGIMVAIATDGKGVWVVTTNGSRVIRSADNGLTWSIIETGVTGSGGRIATDKKGTWFALTGNAWGARSKDNGLTWQKVALPMAASVIATNGTGIWLVGAGSGQARSTDNSDTWAATPNSSGAYAMTYASGCFITAFQQTQGDGGSTNRYYYYVGFSKEGVSPKYHSYIQQYQGDPTLYIAADDSGVVIVTNPNAGGHARFTGVSVDASGNVSYTPATISFSLSYPGEPCTDGKGVWVIQSWGTYGFMRAAPPYDIKTTFRVPKSAAQPAPFANFVKAK
ncbi:MULTISPECIES: WD40/YVTN/BNR-like repeat-containing protein [Pseudomonas]|uniref:WD40/YVTN/BNR-like repeat-containing protein n=1 Tax=Pseudomonas TaxID=286 RepID=UPI0002E5CBDE|nr:MULTISPECIES: sialidase family protein [Pseudomonas]MDC7830310.1 sialidase family protein [Pseudomonas benzopyrenica]